MPKAGQPKFGENSWFTNLPSKQRRRYANKHGGVFVPLGRIDTCPECGSKKFGKHGQKSWRNDILIKPLQPYCSNCGYNKPDSILR